MDLVTRADLVELTQREPKDAHVSLFIPTDRSSTPMSVQADRIAWRNLLTGTESVLSQQGMRAPDIAELLAPAWDLHKDEVAWRYMSDGLALFLRPGWHRSFRVPVGLPEVGAVGDRFIIGPLLRIIASDRHFLLLALSQQQIRVLDASMQRVDELELRDVPTSLREVIEPPEARSDTMARLTSGGAGGPGDAPCSTGMPPPRSTIRRKRRGSSCFGSTKGCGNISVTRTCPWCPWAWTTWWRCTGRSTPIRT